MRIKTRFVGIALASTLGLVGVAHAAPVLKTTAFLRFTPMTSPTFSSSTNYFDPANGFVPSNTSNTAGITVPVDNNVEFGYDDGVNRDTVNFINGTSLVFKDVSSNGAYPFRITVFTNRAHFFDNIQLTFDDFNTIFRVSPTGSALTFISPNLIFAGPSSRTSIFTFAGTGSGAVPEPLTWAMMLMGFGAVGAMMRRARLQPKLRLSYSA